MNNRYRHSILKHRLYSRLVIAAVKVGCYLCLLLCALHCHSCAGASDATNDVAVIQAELLLKNGTRVRGVPSGTFHFKSPEAGQLSIPVQRMHSAVWLQEKQAVQVQLNNQDQLNLVWMDAQVMLNLGMKELSHPTKEIESVTLYRISRNSGLLRGLIARWCGENTARDAIGERHGQLLSEASCAPGKVGNAFHFRGINSRVFIRESDDFPFPKSFTIEGWVKVDNYPGGSGVGFIAVRGAPSMYLGAWNLVTYSRGIVLATINSGSLTETLEVTATPVAQWFHLALTFDDSSGQFAIYLNGRKRGELTTKVRPVQKLVPGPQSGIAFGNQPGELNPSPLRGMLDEWGIYDWALDSETISRIIEAGQENEHLLPLAGQ